MSSRFHRHEWDTLPEQAFRPRGGKGVSMTLEGGGKGGSSAPPPDPRLVEAQIKSLGVQDDAIGQTMDLAKRYAPLQEQSLQLGLAAQRTAADESAQDRTWTLGRRDQLSGLQDSIVSDATTFDTDAYRERLAADAGADVRTSFGLARDQQLRQMATYGVDPNSGAGVSAMQRMNTDEAAAAAAAMNKTRLAAIQMGWDKKAGAASMLAGYPALGLQTTAAGAGYGANGVTLTNAGVGGMMSGYGTVSTMAGGLGTNATNAFNAQANYKSAQDKIAADSDPFNTILGAAAGAGTSIGLRKMFPMPG